MGTVTDGLRKGTIIYNEEDGHYYSVTANDTIFNGNHQAIGLEDITGNIDGTLSSTFQINNPHLLALKLDKSHQRKLLNPRKIREAKATDTL